ncbi:MAG: hypothetical protein HQK62_12295 [Desulfamplus sp.]|nr:hypothetical protein [Desulfamplus sp.]MBF0259597.1 hypothetical protein [Desulfamplus sp.]
MTREDLIKSAGELKKVIPEALNEYKEKRDKLVSIINDSMLKRADIKDLVGEKNFDMMKDNHKNHAMFVESIMSNPNPEVLTDTVLWVFRSYRSRGFHQNYWAAQLSTWIDIIKANLSKESFDAIYPLYNWFTINIPHFTNLSDKQLENFVDAPEHH